MYGKFITALVASLGLLVWGSAAVAQEGCNAVTTLGDGSTPVKGYCYASGTDSDITSREIFNYDKLQYRASPNSTVEVLGKGQEWFVIELKNPYERSMTRYLTLGTGDLREIEVLKQTGSGIRNSVAGKGYPFDVRDFQYKDLIYPVKFGPGETKKVAIRTASETRFALSATVGTPQTMVAEASESSLMYGLVYGALGFVAIINFLFFVFIREAQFGFGALFVGASLFFISETAGLSFQYFWPQLPWLASRTLPLAVTLLALTHLMFAASFLRISGCEPRLQRSIWALCAGGVFTITLNLVTASVWSLVASGAFVYSTLLILAAAAVVRSRDGFVPARWYLGMWTLLFVTVGSYSLSLTGYWEMDISAEITLQTIVLTLAILVTYALVYRFVALYRSNLHYRATLERAVQKRTEELSQATEKLKKSNEALHKASREDALTGLPNRRHFNEETKKLFAAAARNGQWLSLMMIDADHFKRVNDTYGHDVGDMVLVHIANILRKVLNRPMDMVARFGGEEFVVMLPETGARGCQKVAEEIRNTIATSPLELDDGSSITMTFSIGAVCTSPIPGDDFEDLFKAADNGVYEAKSAGRDRVIFKHLYPKRQNPEGGAPQLKVVHE